MKKKLLQILSLSLAALMLTAALSACGEKPGETASTTAAAATEADPGSAAAEVTTEKELTLEDILGFAPSDHGGYEVRMLMANTDEYEHLAPDENGEMVNDTVFRRNKQVEETFGITLQTISKPCDWGDRKTFVAEFQNPVMTGDKNYDIVVGQAAVMATGYGSGYLLNAADMEYIDLDREWWVADQFEHLQINNIMYGIYGDMNLSLYGDMHAIFFNSQIVEDKQLDDPYKLVADDKWTIDKFIEMAAAGGTDLDGDGKFTFGTDITGFTYSTNPCRALYTCFGFNIIERDADGAPSIVLEQSEKYYDIYMKISDMFKNGSYNAVGNNDTKNQNSFAEDKVLFMPGNLCWIANQTMREMPGSFGIVIYPKLDETQENYMAQVATGATCTAFPVNISEPELSAQICSYMGYLGLKDVVPVYFNTYLGERLSKSVEMQQQLNLIREKAVITLTTTYATMFSPGMLELFQHTSGVDKGHNIASSYKATVKSYTRTLEDKVLPLYEKAQ